MEQSESQITGGITINVDVRVRNNIYAKEIIFGILQHVIVNMENIYQILWMVQQLFVMKL